MKIGQAPHHTARTSTPDADAPHGHLSAPDSASAGEVPDTLESHAILQGRKSVQIEHNGAFYQLRTTKLGKLILTK